MPCEPAPEMSPFLIFRQVSRYAILHQPHQCAISTKFPEIRVAFRQSETQRAIYVFEPHGVWRMRYRTRPGPCVVLVDTSTTYDSEGLGVKPSRTDIDISYCANLDEFVARIERAFRGAAYG